MIQLSGIEMKIVRKKRSGQEWFTAVQIRLKLKWPFKMSNHFPITFIVNKINQRVGGRRTTTRESQHEKTMR